jgi:urea transport system substrate-binding protein
VTEDEILGIGGENIEGAYACMKYFQSLDNPNNEAFVEAFKADVGPGQRDRRRHPGCLSRSVAVEGSVERAGSFDIDKVREASPGIELDTAPEGYVEVHDNHHLWSRTRVGRARDDGQYEVIYETAELVEPNPFPEGYQ